MKPSVLSACWFKYTVKDRNACVCVNINTEPHIFVCQVQNNFTVIIRL